MKVAGIYLAAGQSSRMGQSKLALQLSPNSTLGGAVLQQLAQCKLDSLAVVVRPNDGLEWLPEEPQHGVRWQTVSCLTAHMGMSFSLRCGLNAVLPSEPDAVLVVLADQPFVGTAALQQLIEGLRNQPNLDYAAYGIGDMIAPPAIFSRSLFQALESLDGDAGARAIFRSSLYCGLVLEPDSPDLLLDADTPEQFEQIRAKWPLN